MQKTPIEYLTHTWNPIAMRCTRCSPGCDNCWHLKMAGRMANNPLLPADEREALAGKATPILRKRELDEVWRTNKPSVIGVQFMGDLFHEDIDFDLIHCVYDLMKACPQHTFIVLTKRPARMLDITSRIFSLHRMGWANGFCNHVYHGLTVCNQQEADEKIPVFLQILGNKFLSIEPMLGEIDLFQCKNFCRSIMPYHTPTEDELITYCSSCVLAEIHTGIHGVILGGENGAKARPMHTDWVRKVRYDCAAAGLPFFFKQWGEFHPLIWSDGGDVCIGNEDGYKTIDIDGITMVRCGNRSAGRLLDGRTHDDLAWRI